MLQRLKSFDKLRSECSLLILSPYIHLCENFVYLIVYTGYLNFFVIYLLFLSFFLLSVSNLRMIDKYAMKEKSRMEENGFANQSQSKMIKVFKSV